MARLNIEDQFWLDCMAIISRFANQDEAVGNAVRFFRHAQEKHKHGELVTEDEFKSLGFSESLIGIFAERTEFGIRAKGGEKHFEWLKNRVEAGRKGGSKPKQTKAKRSKAKQTEASYSSSPSSSSSCSSSSSSLDCDGPKPNAATSQTWLSFSTAYRKRYGVEATRNARVNSQMKSFLDRVPESEAPYIAEFFIRHNGPRYVQSGHAVGLLLQDAEKLRTEWLTGKKITRHDAQQGEIQDALKNQLDRLAEESA